MKQILLLTAAIAISFLSFAQPSVATMTAKINSGGKLVSVEMGGSGISEDEYFDGAWHSYYRHSYHTKSRTEYPGIYIVYFGSIQYELIGGSYQFSQYLVGDSWYEGVPNPDREEVLALFNADLKAFLRHNEYNSIVGEVSEITFPDDPEYKWHELNYVEFKVNVTFTEIVTYTELETAIHTLDISLRSDAYQAPWNSFISTYDYPEKVVISRDEYTEEEVSAMKTLADIDAENKAAIFLASLPEVEDAPVFKSEKQLFYYIHEKIMTESTEDVKAHLYKVIDASCYKENSDVLLNMRAEKWCQLVATNHDAYKGAHCMYPNVKSHQYGMIIFFDKENRRELSFRGTQSGDTWKLTEVGFYPAKEDELARMKANDASCSEKPDLTVREVKTYVIGDRVNGKFSNGTFPGFIEKLDPNMPNRYFMKLDGDNSGKGYWMDEVNLESGSAASATEEGKEEVKKETTTTTTTQVTFKVGDKVLVNTSSGKKKGKIIKYASHKYLVKFNDPRLGDTWCADKNLEMQ